jgi:hypothetical protein
VHNSSRCGEIDERFPGLIRAIVNAHLVQSGESRPKKSVAKKGFKRAAKAR